MDFNQFVQWAFLGLLTGGIYILWDMKKSVQELNTQIAVVIEKISSHERRIEKLEEKV